MFFFIKTLASGLVIAFVSWLAGRRPVLAGFLVALPLISILSIFFSYIQYRDMQKINEFAASILVGVPLSLTFFLPFILNRWLKMNFIMTFGSALLCLAISYGINHLILRRA